MKMKAKERKIVPSPHFSQNSSRANGDRVLVRVSSRFAGEAGSTPCKVGLHLCEARAGESNEVRTSAGIPERSRRFVRNAG